MEEKNYFNKHSFYFRLVGGYLTLSPELCMVVEDESGLVGYAMAALNVKSYNQKIAVSWIPELRMKYPLDNSISELPQNVQVYDINNFLYALVLFSYDFFCTNDFQLKIYAGCHTIFPFIYSGCVRTIVQTTSIETCVRCATKCNRSVYL